MKTRLLKAAGFLSSAYLTAAVSAAQAAETYGLDKAAGEAGLKASGANVPQLIGRFLGTILGFTGTIFFVLVVWAGLLWMTAAGNEEQIGKAKKILAAAIVGLIIVLSAYAITRFVGESLQ